MDNGQSVTAGGEQVAVIYTDGACSGNPGPGGIGIVICRENGEVLREISAPIGRTTNNLAEYQALVTGLKEGLVMGCTGVVVYTDSQLMAHQINGLYKVKDQRIWPRYQEARALLSQFRSARVQYVPRERNARADRLARVGAQTALEPADRL